VTGNGQLAFLRERAPVWISWHDAPASHVPEGAVHVTATRAYADGRPWEIELLLHPNHDAQLPIEIREIVPGSRLPSRCIERHIQPTGSFCVGWGPTTLPTVCGPADADEWWGRLGGYLELQITAEATPTALPMWQRLRRRHLPSLEARRCASPRADGERRRARVRLDDLAQVPVLRDDATVSAASGRALGTDRVRLLDRVRQDAARQALSTALRQVIDLTSARWPDVWE
jgi:hypothetical protein